MSFVIFNPIVGEIECVGSTRSRYVRISVRSDGSLLLTYPRFSSVDDAIAFAEKRAEWIRTARRKMAERVANYPTISLEEREALRRDARSVIPTLVATLAQRHGLSYTSLRISSAHTRWGSCSTKNGISISLFVMLLPEHLREFIILHELCHTRHHNHSAAFHTLLDTLTDGKEKALNRELKAHKIPRLKS